MEFQIISKGRTKTRRRHRLPMPGLKHIINIGDDTGIHAGGTFRRGSKRQNF